MKVNLMNACNIVKYDILIKQVYIHEGEKQK